MNEPVHGRRSAIYAVPQKRLPPSFFLGLGVAIVLHAGLAYYLFHQNFTAAVEAVPIGDPPTILTMDKPVKPETPKPPVNTIRVHATPETPAIKDPTPLVAQPHDDGPITTTPTTTLPTTTGPATSETSSSAVEAPYVTARWSRFPSSETLADYYPPRAADAEIEGTATVQCTVLDTSGRVSCVAISESPGGYGFGQATVRMVQDKGRVDTTQGNIRVGSMLRQTVAWRLN